MIPFVSLRLVGILLLLAHYYYKLLLLLLVLKIQLLFYYYYFIIIIITIIIGYYLKKFYHNFKCIVHSKLYLIAAFPITPVLEQQFSRQSDLQQRIYCNFKFFASISGVIRIL